MLTNVGPVRVRLGNRNFVLRQLSPEGAGAVVAVLMDKKPLPAATSRVLADADKLSPEVFEKAYIAALKLDHEEALRERFAPPAIPQSAMMDADVVAMMLHLMAVADQPDMTLDACTELVKALTAQVVAVTISRALPEDPEKKSAGPSDSSESGYTPTGPPSPPNSSRTVAERSTR